MAMGIRTRDDRDAELLAQAAGSDYSPPVVRESTVRFVLDRGCGRGRAPRRVTGVLSLRRETRAVAD